MLDAGITTSPMLAAPHAVDDRVVVPACPNCGSAVVREFCAECGERQPSRHDYSMRGMLVDAFHDVTSLDGRLVRSVIALVVRPGLLTREWFAGRRGRYVKPFSLFLMLNVAFFIVQPHTSLLRYELGNYVYGSSGTARKHQALVESARAARGETPEVFSAHFNAVLQEQKKTLLIFCVPLLALALTVVYIGSGQYVAKHVVFSIHAYAFLLVVLGGGIALFFKVLMPAIVTVGIPERWFGFLDSDAGISVILAVVMGAYLYNALRRVYGDRPLPAIARAALLFLFIGQLTNVYHDVLFYTTLYSL